MSENEKNFAGKTAVITGGSRGIGKSICLEFALRGANVAFLYAGNTEKAEETLAKLTSSGVKAAAYKCSVTDADEVKRVFAQIVGEFGGIDMLVNNAGITTDKLTVMMSPEEFTRVVDVNLNGAFNCIKYALPPMMKRKSGKIINISSVSGLMGNPGQINYAASKAGLVGVTKTVAKEYAAKGITCNAIAPGYVETDMTAAFSENERVLQAIPLRRFAKPQEIAYLAAFLASPAADYITGEVIRVDGGLAM